jgi:DNA topoisomerase-1
MASKTNPFVREESASPQGTSITLAGTEPKRHDTTPPARFTEASLIKELERLGIGRPSTYAPTIATIVRRGYVNRQNKALVPSFTAFAVTKLLRDHFGDFVETDFTAEMEEDLDEISRGERVVGVLGGVLLRRQEASWLLKAADTGPRAYRC